MKLFPLRAAIAASLSLYLCGCTAQKPQVAAPPTPKAMAAPSLSEVTHAETQPAAQQAPAAKPVHPLPDDKALIAAAKQAYVSGVAQYQAGKYQAARADFNRAFDIFVTSGKDLKQDAALNSAFEDTIDKINSLEMDALDQSNGFTQQEQTPVGVANDVTFPVDPRLLARAEADLKITHSDLPLVVNNQVASYINYFTNTSKGHNTIENSLAREGRYRGMVKKILADAGVPQDLIYLAIAESGFRPRAVNPHSGAGGMWQFMPHGDYGLVRNAWVDQRFDPKKSTEAYARYIKQLHEQFGDWYLAMAAYDWGPGSVQRAVQRTGYADFWELYRLGVLPEETKNYVPIILAAAIMAKNPSQYGLTDIPTDPPLETDTVTTHAAINLHLVADLVGADVAQVQALNPALLRMSTPDGMDYDLHLPKGTGQLFEQRLAMIPEKNRDSWRFHVAAAGDTVNSIASSFHVTRASLEAANHLQPGDAIDPGEALVIPVSPRRMRVETRYRIRRGDTLISIADRFGVTTRDLRRWNHLHSNRIRAGQHLYVAEPVRRYSSRQRSDSGGSYRIRSGDTLSEIAHRFGVTTSDLRRWNHLDSNRIAAGHHLVVHRP